MAGMLKGEDKEEKKRVPPSGADYFQSLAPFFSPFLSVSSHVFPHRPRAPHHRRRRQHVPVRRCRSRSPETLRRFSLWQ